MAQTIKLKRSANTTLTSGQGIPTTSQLALGEVAINTHHGKMYIKKNDGSDSIVEVGGTATQQTAIWQPYAYTATSNQTTFTGSDDNSRTMKYIVGYLEVYVNGLLLDPSTDYTATNGVSIVLATAASASDLVQINTFVKVIGTGDITLDTFTGNGSTAAYTLSVSPGSENNTQVYVNAVYQNKDTYTVSGTTLTFDTAPVNNAEIEVTAGSRNVSFTDVNDLTISGDLVLADTKKLKLGNSSDLEIYHDTSNSIIRDNGAGHIQILSGTVTVGNAALSKTSALFSSGGAQTLYYDNDPMFVTSSTGIGITGNIAVSGTVDGVDIATRDGILTSTTTTAGAALPKAGGAMTGAITTNSTFDGRDVATDGTKLDGIEVGADVTDTANVTSSGALMDSEVTNLAQVKAFDSSDYATAAQGTTANAALPKAGGTMTGDLLFGAGGEIQFGGSNQMGLFTSSGTSQLRINSGIFKLRADDMRFTAQNGTTEFMRIDSSGNVGIGTDDPTVNLNLRRETAGNIFAINRVASATHALYVGISGNDTSFYANNGIYKLGINNPLGTGGEIPFITMSPTNRYTTFTAGNVGIGTDAPVDLLTIQSPASGGGNGITLKRNDNGTDQRVGAISFGNTEDDDLAVIAVKTSTGNNSDGNLEFYTQLDADTTPTKRMTIASDGNVGIGNVVSQAYANEGTYTTKLRVGSDTLNTDQASVIQIAGKDSSGNGILGVIEFLNHRDNDVVAKIAGRRDLGSGSHLGAGQLDFSTDDGSGNLDIHMSIDANGNVGIGTDDPVGNLHIVGGDGVNGSSTIGGSSNDFIIENNSNAGMTIRSGANENGVISFADPDSHNVGQVYYMHDIDAMRFTTNSAVQMTVDSAGTVDVANDLLANNAKLKAIAESNTDTAVDVFVYDTRKDSDGGAWRKRTQHTSWYNETLNTSTRGARKEFPSVAVIVIENSELTIYDGDDPDMPMWMVFDGAAYSMLSNTHNGITGAIMENGNLVVISTSGYNHGGVSVINFISDYAYLKTAGYTKENTTGIVNRGNAFSGSAGSHVIVNNNVRDVAITVLPNAPIDADTGLPVPTIAIGTDGGISVIKDNGTVVDITYTSYTGSEQVKFLPSGGIIYSTDNGSTNQRWIHVDHSLPSANLAKADVGYKGALDDEMYHLVNTSTYAGQDLKLRIDNSTGGFIVDNNGDVVLGSTATNGGLGFISRNPTNPSEGLTCEITSSHNTGWMPGDIKLATLSDTDTTNISASGNTNILAGKTYTNNASFPYETFTSSGLDITSAINTTAYGAANLTWVSTPGKTYTAYFNLTLNSGTAPILFMQTSSSFGNGVQYQTVNGVNSFTFTATRSGSIYFSFSVQNGVATNFSVANLELYEGGVADHSVNGTTSGGLSVFGTVTKTAVATGADLVGYSGFSGSNYLRQLYNSDLDFGTGEFSITLWFKLDSNSGSSRILYRQQDTSNRWTFYSNSGYFWFYQTDGTPTYSQSNLTHSLGEWNHVVVRRGTSKTDFVLNGEVIANSNSYPGTITRDASFTGDLYVGHDIGGSGHWGGDLSLVRVSNTIPSLEQIKKIYNDEKHLFQENAKCTLYGTSDGVTALAYDDDTELLHAGTSAGRSEFQGLRRVNNTTDAVGTSISASNGFIVED